MDVSQAIRDAENALRDLICWRLKAQHGEHWEAKLGVSAERIAQWRDRKKVEAKRQKGAPVEDRLLYYADFYDLSGILQKNWDLFSEVLGEKKTIEVWLSELERLRDPNAHNRDLLPYQKHLALGISGDIRGRVLRYRSKMKHVDDYFPRIESARDSVGHSVGGESIAKAKPVVREGDTIEYVVTATDPMGDPLQYGYCWHPGGPEIWTSSNFFSLTVGKAQVGKHKELMIRIRSLREAKAKFVCDDFVIFTYDVLPERLPSSGL